MQFQSTVRLDQGHGIVGEFAYDSPQRAQPYTIRPNATAANCVVGRAFTLDTSTNNVIPGGDPTAVPFAGILCNPKVYAAVGTVAGGTLAPSLIVPPGTNGEFAEMGFLWLIVAEACKVDDLLYMDTTTGEIHAWAAGASGIPAGQKQIPNAKVARSAQANVPGLIIGKFTN